MAKAILQAKAEASATEAKLYGHMAGLKCQGCSAALVPAEASVCPLCAAEGKNDSYFCSQECFAKNWLVHRDALHPSGKVKAKKEVLPATDKAASGKKRKRGEAALEAGEEDLAATAVKSVGLWPTLSLDVLTKSGGSPAVAHTKPWTSGVSAVDPKWKRLCLECPPSSSWTDAPTVWGALLSVVDLYRQASASASSAPFFILCGSQVSATAVAWFFTCNKVTDFDLMLSVDWWNHGPAQYRKINGGKAASSSNLHIASVQSLMAHREASSAKKNNPNKGATGGGAGDSTSAALEPLDKYIGNWTTENSTLVVLPDVADADQYQPLTVRAAFFEEEAATKKKTGAITAITVKIQPVPTGSDDHSKLFAGSTLIFSPKAAMEALLTAKGLQQPLDESDDSEQEVEDVSEDEAAEEERSSKKAAAVAKAQLQSTSDEFQYDDQLCHALVSGNTARAKSRLTILCNEESHLFAKDKACLVAASGVVTRFEHVERILQNGLVLCMGVKNVATAAATVYDHPARLKHHSTAWLWRTLLALRGQFDKKHSHEFQNMLCRVFPRLLGLLPKLAPLSQGPGTPESPYSMTLQATLCFLLPLCHPVLIDAAAEAWGIRRVVKGPDALKQLTSGRGTIIHHLKTHYEPKLGPDYTQFLTILMHLLHGYTSLAAITVPDVAAMLCWGQGLADDMGGLVPFLRCCELLQLKGDQSNSKSVLARRKTAEMKQQKKGGAGAANTTNLDDYSTFVRPTNQSTNKRGETKSQQTNIEGKIPFTELPLAGSVKKHNLGLERMAADEILNIMPRKKVPIYLGEIGTNIGIWSKFNAKYKGVLPPTLKQFIEKYPEHFSLVDNIVMRAKESNLQEFSIPKEGMGGRAEEDRLSDGGDNEPGKNKKQKKRLQELLTGAKMSDTQRRKVAKSGRVRRKLLKKLNNKKKYNNNKRDVDQSARVPGYKKPRAKKVAGRGKKVNARNFKR